jgi:hypothetical protein
MLSVARAFRHVISVTAPSAMSSAATAAYVDDDTEVGTPAVHNQTMQVSDTPTASVNLVVYVNERKETPIRTMQQ